jgi:hypothetical protein
MVFHKADPANFEGPGGLEYDPEVFKYENLRADLANLAIGCCMEHGAKIIEKILTDYKVTPRRGHRYF